MKIEICEQMAQSWLSHIKGCQVVQTNWSVSPLQMDLLKNSPQYKNSEAFISQIQSALSSHIFPGSFDAGTFLNTLATDMVSDLYEGASFEEDTLQYSEDNNTETFYRQLMSLVGFAQKIKGDSGKWINDITILSKANNKDPFFTFIKQCETDVVGIKVNDNLVEKVYFVDTAFHSDGLNYSGTSNTETRVTKKLIKFIAVADLVFGTKVPIHIIFAAPYCRQTPFDRIKYILDNIIRPCANTRPALAGAPNNITIDLYCNDDFTQNIYEPLKANLDKLNNDNELFIRALNLAKICENPPTTKKGPSGKKSAAASAPKKNGKTLKELEAEYTYQKLMEVAACYLCNSYGLQKIEKLMNLKENRGFEAQNILNELGILTDGTMKKWIDKANIDARIAGAAGILKDTLKEIKNRNLL